MKAFLALLFVALLPAGLHAQQLDNPVTVPVSYYGWGQAASGDGSFYFGDELGARTGAAGGNGAAFYSAPVTVQLVPGKEYLVQMHNDGLSVAYPYFQSRPGYDIYLNGTKTTTIGGDGYNYYFRVRVEAINDLAGSLAGTRGGECSSFPEDKPIWYVGLGTMRNGRFAGAVGFRAGTLVDGTGAEVTRLFNSSALVYDSVDNTEVSVTRDPNGYITQIQSREVVVLVDAYNANSTSYDIKVCAIATPTAPFITYTVKRRAVSGGYGIQIDRTEDGVTWSTALEQVVATPTVWTRYGWRVNSGGVFDTTNKAVTTWSGSTATSNYGGGLHTQTKNYASFPWGSIELTGRAAGSAPAASYTYYADSTGSGWAQAVKSMTDSHGNWIKYDYYNTSTDSRAGLVHRIYRPWLDSPADADSASTGSGHVEAYAYVANFDGQTTAPGTRLVTINGTQVAKTTWEYNFNHSVVNTHTLSEKIQKDYSNATDFLTTTSLSYLPTATDTYFRGRSHSITHPDGRKDSFAYFKGTWNAGTRTFTGSAGGSDRLVLAFHGQTSGGTSVSSWTNGSVTWTIDALHLLAGRSTATETVVDSTGRTVFAAENVYTASGALERLSGTAYSFDPHGRLVEEIDVMRSVGENQIKTARTYTAALLDTITDPDGFVTRFEYDNLLRMWCKTVGEGGPAAYPARVTALAFDAANRVTGISPSRTGTPIVLTLGYDTAGRLISRLEPSPAGGNLTTSYDHSVLRRLTTTLSSGAILVDEIYRDGRPKALGGSARAPVEYDYAVNSTGIKLTRKNGSTTANGWSETQFDHLGRVAKQSAPTWGWTASNSNIVDVDFTYDLATGLPEKQATTHRATPANPLVPDRLFVYDTGRLTQEGLDVNADGFLTSDSNDRITLYDTSFTKDTWGWKAYSTTSIYRSSGATAATIAEVYTRLTGFNGGAVGTHGLVVGDTVSIDSNGRSTTAWDFVDTDPAQKRRRSEVQVQGASVTGYAESKNGYSYESQAIASGARTRHAYDGLGRLQYTYHRWNGSAFTATDSYSYHGNTSYIDTQTVGGVTSAFAYAWGSSTHTVTATTDGISSYTLYNAMGLPKHVGGAGASPLEYGYDALGRRTTLTTWRNGPFTEANWPTSAGDTTTWNLEPATGLLIEKIYADHTTNAPRKVGYTYTPLGQTLTRTWARGVTTTYGYFDGSTTTTTHASHRTYELRAITYSDGTPGTSYTYTRAGQLRTATDVTGTRDFIYAPERPLRLDAEALGSFYNNRVLTQQYDAVYRGTGFKLGVTGNLAEDLTQTHVYAATGLFDHIDTQRAALSARTFTYGFHANTGLVSGYSSGSFSAGYDYEADTGLRARVEAKWDSLSLARFDIQRDDRGLIRSVKQSGSAFADYYEGASYNSVFNYYAYNSRGELQTVAMYRGAPPEGGAPSSTDELPGRRFEYRYDSMGNRRTAGSTGTATGGDEEYALRSGGLNQYLTKENNTVRVLGTASVASVIAAGSTGTTGAPVLVAEKDRSFAADAGPANSGGPQRGTITVTATLPGTGGGADVVKTLERDWLIPRQTQTFDYDPDGNLTSDGMWTYVYDAENRLTQMTSQLPAGQGFARRQLDFKYDYVGRRVEKAVLNLDSAASTTQRFLYDGWNLVAELNGTGTTLQRSYTWGLDVVGSLGATAGVGALVQITDHGTSKSYLPGYDGNGNVIALFDADPNNNGARVALYEYSPFGELLRAEGDYAAANPFRFSTRFTDTETSLVYYGLRYYSPRLGRFINRDPIGEAGGANLYRFAGNNGVNGLDVLGLKPEGNANDPFRPFDPIWSSSPTSISIWIDNLLSNWFGGSAQVPGPWTNGSVHQPGTTQSQAPRQPSADVGPAVVSPDGQVTTVGPNSEALVIGLLAPKALERMTMPNPGPTTSARGPINAVRGAGAAAATAIGGVATGAIAHRDARVAGIEIARDAFLRGEISAVQYVQISQTVLSMNLPDYGMAQGGAQLNRSMVQSAVAQQVAVAKAQNGERRIRTIGLGLEEDLGNHRGTGAIIYKNAGWQLAGLTTVDWGRAAVDNYYFKQSFLEAAQRAEGIRFDVSSLSMTQSGMTTWELGQITSNPALLAKTTFIRDGQVVTWNGSGFVAP